MKTFFKKLALAIFIPRLFLAISILVFSLLILFSLDNLSFLQPVKNILDSETLSISINEDNYSVYDGIRFILLSTAFFSITGFVIDLADKGINKLSKLNSSIFNSNTINRISLISKIVLFIFESSIWQIYPPLLTSTEPFTWRYTFDLSDVTTPK